MLLPFDIAANDSDIVHLSTGEWKPYISESADDYGDFTRIVTEAFQAAGKKVDYSFYPWKRALYLAKTGEVQGVIAVTKNPQREQDYWFSKEPIISSERVFFHLRSTELKWTTVEDLAPFHIGATEEYHYGSSFAEAEKQGRIHVERADTDVQNFKMLLAGRIDIFPITYEIGNFILRNEFPESTQVTYNPKPLNTTPFYILLSKKHPENEQLIADFDKGFAKLKKSGRYSELLGEMKKGLEAPSK